MHCPFMQCVQLWTLAFETFPFCLQSQHKQYRRRSRSSSPLRLPMLMTMPVSLLQKNPCMSQPSGLSKLLKRTVSMPKSASAQIEREVMLYFTEDVAPDGEDPLTWWRRNGARFPSMAGLARQYLCVPATSVPAEHVFFGLWPRCKRVMLQLVPRECGCTCFSLQELISAAVFGLVS